MEICHVFYMAFFAYCINLNKFGLLAATGTQCHVTSPDAAWLEDCNWCSCVKTDNGEFAACTQMACHPGFKPEGTGECKGDAKWKKDCNWCTCFEEQASCTKRLCRSAKQLEDVPPDKQYLYAECAEIGEGASFKRNCNTCTCTSINSAVCTKRACLDVGSGKQLQVSVSPGIFPSRPSPECAGRPAGYSFQKGCNSCTCSSTGVAACTQRFCVQGFGKQLQVVPSTGNFSPASPECVGRSEGYSFKKECNSCTCTSTGVAACTQRFCIQNNENNRRHHHHLSTQNDPSRFSECRGRAVGESFQKDCNTCTCTDTGIAACTLRLCIQAGSGKQLYQSSEGNLDQSAECGGRAVGESFQKDCNTCTCTETGIAACTMRLCVQAGTGDQPQIQIHSIDAGNTPVQSPECAKLKEGETFQRDCNSCTCTSSGVAACTMRFCIKVENNENQSEDSTNLENKSPECEAKSEGATFPRDCNMCYCSSTGVADCTQKTCIREGRKLQLSQAGAEICSGQITWKNDCNFCRCNNGVAVCSKRLCRPQAKQLNLEEVRTPKLSTAVCEARSENSWWMSGCDKCSCSGNASPTCSKVGGCVGSDSLVRQAGECDGDVSWKRSCNWCSCVSGRAICQRRACEEDEGTTRALLSETDPDCKFTSQGARWRNLCNWCSCSSDHRASCTRRACPPDYESREQGTKECEVDASWRKDCNWCNCANDKAVCSKRICSSELETKDVAPVANEPAVQATENVSKPALECTEGSRWRVDCNWCFCSNDIGACTLRGCIGGGGPSSEPECKDVSEWKRREKDNTCSWCVCKDEKSVCSPVPCEGTKNAF